jgi:hypothetical protein
MAASIERLAIINPAASTNTIAFTADSTFLVSVIATNKSNQNNATISIWVAPLGNDTAGSRGYIVSNLSVSYSNSYETFRFAMNNTDVLRVESSTADVSFYVQGIDQLVT